MEEDESSETPSGRNQPSTGNTPRAPSASISAHERQTATPVASTASGPPSSGPSSSGAAMNAQGSKRRRGLGIVTPNACTECRKKRAKCDGQRPCGRCRAQNDVSCVYEIPVRQSKENLRTEIETLRLRKHSSDQIFAALVRPELWEEVLTRLRGGQSVEDISDWVSGVQTSGVSGVDASSSLPSFSQNARDPSQGSGMRSTLEYGDANERKDLTSMTRAAGALSPPTAAQQTQSAIRGDVPQTNSPWNFSSHSQAGSTRSSSHPDAMIWTTDVAGPPQSRVGVWAESLQPDMLADGTPRFKGLEQVLSPLVKPERRSQASTWTNVTSDNDLVQHLLALYFCWEYPTFASLSKEHFLRDFQEGLNRYCSPILVNALLALGCRFSSQPMTRENEADPYSSGDHFFKESQRLFYLETDHHCLTTIQALGIMSIREASCGRDSESWYYAGQSIRLAIEMGLHRIHDKGDEDEIAVQAATFWGAFALDQQVTFTSDATAWSLATGSLPQCSCFPQLPPKPAIINDIEASLWVPYTDNGGLPATLQNIEPEKLTPSGAPLQRSCEQPSNVRSVYKCFCELSELVHQSLYVLHSPGRPLTARDLLSIYTQYLNWYDRIPEVLRLGHNFTPAVLFAHMYYHFAILLLFRPLIKLRILGSKVAPRDVCSQAADAIQGLCRSYSQLYTLRRTPSFVPYFVLTSSIMHLAIGAANVSSGPESSTESSIERAVEADPHVSESIKQGIADLAEMAPCHHFAEQALNILRYLALKWNIEVDIDSGKTTPEDYERFVKPYTSSLNFFAPNVQPTDCLFDWGVGRATAGEEEPAAAMESAENMENPLFWPFPLQGRPILPDGKDLEQAGFALL